MMMDAHTNTTAAPALFDGIPAAKLERETAHWGRRTVPAGTVLQVQGERPAAEAYLILAGTVELVVERAAGVAAGDGSERQRYRGAGDTVGETGFIADSPNAATARALSDVELLVITGHDFRRLARRFPRVYRNLGRILAYRLEQVYHAEATVPGHLTFLRDEASPPLLGYALACSLAWHRREPVLLLLVADAVPEQLAAFGPAHSPAELTHRGIQQGDAQRSGPAALLVLSPAAGTALAAIMATAVQLCDEYRHVLIQAAAPITLPVRGHAVVLQAAEGAAPPDATLLPGHAVCGWVAGGGFRPDAGGVLRVPPPTEAELAALRDGVLPATGPAGKAIGWLARDLAAMKVGVALGAGAAKGYAHLGVLHALDQLGVPVDYMAGTSIGAAVATLYACGLRAEQMVEAMDLVGRAAFRLSISRRSLLSIAGVQAAMQRIVGQRRFQDLDLPLAVVATDIVSRQQVVFKKGLLWPAVLASTAIPAIYPPQRMAGYTLVDGGVLNPVPTDVVVAMGADLVIAVKLSSHPLPASAVAEAVLVDHRPASVLQAITHTIDLMQSKITADSAATATIVLEPPFRDTDGRGLRNFSQGRRFIAGGEATALQARQQLAGVLPWLRTELH